MKEYYHFPIFLVLIAGLSSVGFANSNCLKDSDCGRGEICCAFKRCRPKGNCIACIIDSHCPKGEKCFNSHCTTSHDSSTESDGEKSCFTDKDCYYSSERQLNCCQEKCTKYSCLSPYTTQPTTTRESCISWRDCSHGEQCEKGSCKKTSNVMLTKAGFLSAAILTGSVFLLILCCCFVRESKYSRQRYAERQRRRSRSRSSRSRRRRSTQQLRPRTSTSCTTTSVENRAFSLDEGNACEGGLPPPEYPGGSSTTDGVLSSVEPAPVTPPPYYTLSFDLPPTYEEALQDEEDRGSSLATVA